MARQIAQQLVSNTHTHTHTCTDRRFQQLDGGLKFMCAFVNHKPLLKPNSTLIS